MLFLFRAAQIATRSPSSSHLLPVLLLGGERIAQVFVHYGQVAGHHRAGAALDETESLLLTGAVEIVEEDPANASSLSSVADVEVSVTPERTQIDKSEE